MPQSNRRIDVGVDADRKQAAAYISELSGNLSVIARRHGLDTLSYLLDVAQMEADDVAQDRVPD